MQTLMGIKHLLGLFLLGVMPITLASAQPIDPDLGCKNNPALVGSCFTVVGDILVYNGSPAIRILPKDTKHLLGVIPSENEIMPADLKAQVSLTQKVSAIMEVCPFSLPKPNTMQLVCGQQGGLKFNDAGLEPALSVQYTSL